MSTKKSTVSASAFLNELLGPLTIAAVIRATREGEEISQKDFAAKLEISKQHLCDIEAGRKPVSPGRAYGWAKKLGYVPETWVQLAIQDQLDREGGHRPKELS